MRLKNKMVQEIIYNVALGANASTGYLYPGWNDAGLAFWTHVPSMAYMTFFFYATQLTRLEFIGAYDATAVTFTFLQFNALAATMTTPYDAPAPWNGTGQIVLPCKYFAPRLTDLSGVNHVETRFYCRIFGG